MESFNGKLRDELLNGGIFYMLLAANVLIERWRRHYNGVRPYSALGYRPPAPEALMPSATAAGSVALGSLVSLRPPPGIAVTTPAAIMDFGLT